MPDIELRLLREHPANVREHLDGITDMAASIRARGILQPLIVQPDPAEPGAFQILAGHRRYAGAKLAGLKTVPCIVRKVSGAEAIQLMLIENCQRSDLDAIEKAEAMGKPVRSEVMATEQAGPWPWGRWRVSGESGHACPPGPCSHASAECRYDGKHRECERPGCACVCHD